MLDDGTVVDAANVVWCTGFKQVFDWIDLPIFDDDGWPMEYRGVVEGTPGLFFCGLQLPVRVQLDGASPASAATRSTSRAGSPPAPPTIERAAA